MSELNIEEMIDPKKEQIYESGAQDEPGNNTASLHKGSKKQSKLFLFLAKIDSDFEEEMENFLLKNKEQFQKRINPPKSISLYEDILIIWAFKKAEVDIKKNKR